MLRALPCARHRATALAAGPLPSHTPSFLRTHTLPHRPGAAAAQVGAELSKAASKSDVDLAFGCQYKLDKDTTVKAKVDDKGMLCASYKQKISALTTMTLAAEVDTVHLENNHKFGLQLNITP